MNRYHVHHRGVNVRTVDAGSPEAAASKWVQRDDAIYGAVNMRPKILTVKDTKTGVETKWCITYTVEKVDES